MSEPKRSYTMPYAADRRKSFFLLAALIVLIPLFLFVHDLRAIDNGFSAEARRNLTILSSALFFPAILLYGVRCFAQLHFVPEGIAVTLWGLTIRRFPAERIRFLSAVHSNSTKADAMDLIAVCDYSLEELTELYPRALWLDCTQKKYFDEQLRQR